MLIGDIFKLFNIDLNKVPSEHEQILKNFLLFQLCSELQQIYCQMNMENNMIATSFIRSLINDLITNQDYSLEGLATYTGYPQEVIFEISAGINKNPTINLALKIIELHAISRRELYNTLIQKIILDQYLLQDNS